MIVIDKDGQADMSFHNIPLQTVKSARFYRKALGTWVDLLKMVVNGITYNIAETAQNGAVVFGSDYSNWSFISPDGRIPYADYSGMTMGEAMDDMERILAEQPIPAWDSFVVWLNGVLGENDSSAIIPENATVKLRESVGGTTTTVSIPSFTATNCVEFLENLETAFAAALDRPAANMLYNPVTGAADALSFYLDITSDDGTNLSILFSFRE